MPIDKVKYWTEISDYDIETAEAMFGEADCAEILNKTKQLQLWIKSKL